MVPWIVYGLGGLSGSGKRRHRQRWGDLDAAQTVYESLVGYIRHTDRHIVQADHLRGKRHNRTAVIAVDDARNASRREYHGQMPRWSVTVPG